MPYDNVSYHGNHTFVDQNILGGSIFHLFPLAKCQQFKLIRVGVVAEGGGGGISAFGRQRHEDQEFKASLNYIEHWLS